jgi:hypothetical protein
VMSNSASPLLLTDYSVALLKTRHDSKLTPSGKKKNSPLTSFFREMYAYSLELKH